MKISTLRRLIGKDDRFFELLESAAAEAEVSVRLFADAVKQMGAGGAAALSLAEFSHARRKEKEIRQATVEALSHTFVTPIEREDIEALSFALYRIPKQVEKIVERLSIYPGEIPHAAFGRQAELLLQAVQAVIFMVKRLRAGPDLERIREANARLQHAEGEADKVMLTLLKELYNSPCTALELIVLQEVYEMVEHAVDRCRNAGNIVMDIVLKQS